MHALLAQSRHAVFVAFLDGGLVEDLLPQVAPGCRLDIRFRMLTPRELAQAQGFPDEYEFAGSRDKQVKQIGNAVPVHTARALCEAILFG